MADNQGKGLFGKIGGGIAAVLAAIGILGKDGGKIRELGPELRQAEKVSPELRKIEGFSPSFRRFLNGSEKGGELPVPKVPEAPVRLPTVEEPHITPRIAPLAEWARLVTQSRVTKLWKASTDLEPRILHLKSTVPALRYAAISARFAAHQQRVASLRRLADGGGSVSETELERQEQEERDLEQEGADLAKQYG